jgi:hypothetical protein
MKKLCLAFVCVAIGIGGWMGLEGRSAAESNPRAGSYHPGYSGGSPPPPLRSSDRGEEVLELQETAIILGTLVALAVIVDAAAPGRGDEAPADATNRHRVHASPAR